MGQLRPPTAKPSSVNQHRTTNAMLSATFSGFQNDSLTLRSANPDRAAFFSFRNLHPLFDPEAPKVSPDLASRGLRYRLNSRVVSASLTGRRSKPLDVSLRLHHLSERRDSTAVCVFWDPDAVHWSSAGCALNTAESSAWESVCECSHLTAFAVLMATEGAEEAPYAAGTEKTGAAVIETATQGKAKATSLVLQVVTYVVAAVLLIVVILILVQVRV